MNEGLVKKIYLGIPVGPFKGLKKRPLRRCAKRNGHVVLDTLIKARRFGEGRLERDDVERHLERVHLQRRFEMKL